MDNKEITELKEYNDLQCDEVTNCINLLIALDGYGYVLSDKMKTELENELQYWLNWYKNCTRIIETEETYTRKYKELELLNCVEFD